MPKIHVASNRELLTREMVDYLRERGIKRLLSDYDRTPAVTGSQEHSELTAFYALAIAHAMNLPKEERRRVCLAAKFHDIGKVGMPTSTFEGRLDDNNIDLIRKHPHEGAYHLTHRMSVDPKLHLDRQTLIYVMDHHERYDGKGYPVGLAGEEIPLGARIIAVADAYATMTAGRPYRKRITHKAAVEEIVRNSGTQFDPTVVEAFTRTFGMAK